ncbi:MAG: hypothetical protein K2W95_29510 [Candidatus Obscuribacterales bacterium]|nr:hypothetical protein [Candidatus Obscuribacterales bacterium]
MSQTPISRPASTKGASALNQEKLIAAGRGFRHPFIDAKAKDNRKQEGMTVIKRLAVNPFLR